VVGAKHALPVLYACNASAHPSSRLVRAAAAKGAVLLLIANAYGIIYAFGNVLEILFFAGIAAICEKITSAKVQFFFEKVSG
jgi:hypothetical protein